MQIQSSKPRPMLRFDQLGASHGTDDQIRRTGLGLSDELKSQLKGLDLTRVRPSQFDPIAVHLYKAGKLSEDVAGKLILFRSPSARTLADDRPFNLIEATDNMARVIRSLSPMSRAASHREGYEGAAYSAKGLATFVKALRAGMLLDEHA
ncbi:MAG TPA: hypothetical protein VGN46_07880 [Luteibacter sp.]|jgi:hypothetical protein|uniref:hypothetical protein n=1 Tax=Luteibacter sp. TaxID=1886636 RepID=UPI002F3F0FEA